MANNRASKFDEDEKISRLYDNYEIEPRHARSSLLHLKTYPYDKKKDKELYQVGLPKPACHSLRKSSLANTKLPEHHIRLCSYQRR